jgi:hypothetical protein
LSDQVCLEGDPGDEMGHHISEHGIKRNDNFREKLEGVTTTQMVIKEMREQREREDFPT